MAEFSRIVITAPSEKIAEVYRLQLAALKSTLSFLRNSNIYCVSDPRGFRVGSGGGTLNALDFLIYSEEVDPCLENEKILIIHSGGDSRRAPLYSLCGKAWTTVNSTIEDSIIGNPLALLIKELSIFCTTIQSCSLVVASSDVLLDIIFDQSGPSEFISDAVSVVSVSEKPEISKNHGVLVIEGGLASDSTHSSGYICAPASNYLQVSLM